MCIVGVFREFEAWPKFYLRSCCAECNIVLYCNALYRESIVSRKQKSRHFDDVFFIGCTGSSQNTAETKISLLGKCRKFLSCQNEIFMRMVTFSFQCTEQHYKVWERVPPTTTINPDEAYWGIPSALTVPLDPYQVATHSVTQGLQAALFAYGIKLLLCHSCCIHCRHRGNRVAWLRGIKARDTVDIPKKSLGIRLCVPWVLGY